MGAGFEAVTAIARDRDRGRLRVDPVVAEGYADRTVDRDIRCLVIGGEHGDTCCLSSRALDAERTGLDHRDGDDEVHQRHEQDDADGEELEGCRSSIVGKPGSGPL